MLYVVLQNEELLLRKWPSVCKMDFLWKFLDSPVAEVCTCLVNIHLVTSKLVRIIPDVITGKINPAQYSVRENQISYFILI